MSNRDKHLPVPPPYRNYSTSTTSTLPPYPGEPFQSIELPTIELQATSISNQSGSLRQVTALNSRSNAFELPTISYDSIKITTQPASHALAISNSLQSQPTELLAPNERRTVSNANQSASQHRAPSSSTKSTEGSSARSQSKTGSQSNKTQSQSKNLSQPIVQTQPRSQAQPNAQPQPETPPQSNDQSSSQQVSSSDSNPDALSYENQSELFAKMVLQHILAGRLSGQTPLPCVPDAMSDEALCRTFSELAMQDLETGQTGQTHEFCYAPALMCHVNIWYPYEIAYRIYRCPHHDDTPDGQGTASRQQSTSKSTQGRASTGTSSQAQKAKTRLAIRMMTTTVCLIFASRLSSFSFHQLLCRLMALQCIVGDAIDLYSSTNIANE